MCNCKKTKVEAPPPPIPVELKEHFIEELNEFQPSELDKELDKLNAEHSKNQNNG